jgi:hypothetical protein
MKVSLLAHLSCLSVSLPPVAVYVTCKESRRLFSSAVEKLKTYETVIFPVLYECEILSLTLRETNRLRVMRRIFGLRNEELHNDKVTENEPCRKCIVRAREQECLQGFVGTVRRKESTRETKT